MSNHILDALNPFQHQALNRVAKAANIEPKTYLNLMLQRCLSHCTGECHCAGSDAELLFKLSNITHMTTQETLDAVIERIELDLAKTPMQ